MKRFLITIYISLLRLSLQALTQFSKASSADFLPKSFGYMRYGIFISFNFLFTKLLNIFNHLTLFQSCGFNSDEKIFLCFTQTNPSPLVIIATSINPPTVSKPPSIFLFKEVILIRDSTKSLNSS